MTENKWYLYSCYSFYSITVDECKNKFIVSRQLWER